MKIRSVLFALILMIFIAGCVGQTTGAVMSIEEAIVIAQNSECTLEGPLTSNYFYNENSKTWWIDMAVEKENCNPACVVDTQTKTAEINWRCMGLLP